MKNTYNTKIRKQPEKNWKKILSRHLIKEDIHMAYNSIFSIASYQRNVN